MHNRRRYYSTDKNIKKWIVEGEHMRIVDALVEVLKEHESLTYKEAYLKVR